MNEINQLIVRGSDPPTIEIDPSCSAVYIRLKSSKVARTISDGRRGAVLAIDLDSKGDVVGVELVGVKEFSISAFRDHLPSRMTRSIDFDRARWGVPARPGRQQLVAA